MVFNVNRLLCEGPVDICILITVVLLPFDLFPLFLFLNLHLKMRPVRHHDHVVSAYHLTVPSIYFGSQL